ncbi:hypothetical protein LINPERHAP2_LOCUS41946 [Linum perenne]
MLVDEQTIVDVEDNVDPCGRVSILGYRSPTTPTLAVTAKSWASPELLIPSIWELLEAVESSFNNLSVRACTSTTGKPIDVKMALALVQFRYMIS